MNDSTRYGIRYLTRLLTLMVCLFSLSAQAQEKVTVMLNPVQQVLPPQAGRYISDPGRYFKVWLINNTDEEQLVHLGLQIEQRFPNQELWVSTNMENGHIPQRPIVLAPNQQKLLNAIEMRHLFDHFTKSDVFIKDGRHLSVTDGDYGLLPEGEYEAFLTAYKWDTDLTSPVVVSDPSGGNTLFNICYEAEPPTFLSPVITNAADELGELKVVKLNKNQPISFTWLAPTLNCNAPLVNFEYAVRIVELGTLMPDEAMHTNTQTFLERKHLVSTTFNLNSTDIPRMIEKGEDEGKIYALQVTATTPYMNENSINFSLIKNDGKSPILLFQLYDPDYKVPELADVPQGGDDGGGGDDNGGGQGGDDGTGGGYILSLDDVHGKYDDIEELYVFSQPKLLEPSFYGKLNRTVNYGEYLDIEWRKAWFEGGRGLEQDTIEFKYSISLYTGNTVDDAETIFKSKPVYTKDNITECKYTLDWTDVDYDFGNGTYFYLRVTAEPTNEELVLMLPDDKNYVDFVLSDGFEETFECGESTANVENTTPITEKPARDATLHIGAWDLTFDDNYNNVKLEEGVLKGTGWIIWPVANLNARVAVKFEDLKVNTDNIVFEGTCKTRGNPTTEKENVTINGKSYSPDEIAKSLFEEDALNDIFGLSGLPAELQEKVQNEGASLAQSYNIGKYYSMYKKAENLWTSGTLADLYFPLELPQTIKDKLPKDFNVQIADISFSPSAAIMNIIAEIVMPNSDVFQDQQVLVFGAPRLCVQPDRILPEDGVISLLSNFPIKDPTSEFVLTFKAPSDPLDPASHDGCFIRWENDEFDALGLEIAMSLPNTKRIINGQTQDDIPALLDLYATIEKGESAVNFLAEGTLTPFEVTDLPGWKFANSTEGNGLVVVFDHNSDRNGDHMPSVSKMDELYPNNSYDFKLCGSGVSASNWDAWTGVYIDNLSVEFPKFAVFGDGDEGLRIGAYNMLIDASGITCKASANNILNAETGSCGGWAFSVDNATVDIVQNNFDNCQIDGSFGVPLLGRAAQKKAAEETQKTKGIKSSDNNDKGDYKDIDYHCEIRHLTAMQDVSIEKWNAAGTEKVEATRRGYKNNRLAYIFSTKNTDGVDLTLNFVLGNMTLENDQTYFLVESIDDDPDTDGDQSYTQVELCMAGDITIAGTSKVNAGIDGLKSRLGKLGDLLEQTKLPLHMPGIHFAKMRLSNKKETEWRTDLGLDKDNLHENRLKAQENWLKDNWNVGLISGDEVELSKDECYFNYGEWSLASERKKIGPFSFNMKEFKPKMEGDKFSLNINGDIGLVEDKICVGGDIAISGTLHKDGGIKNIKNWYLSDGDVDLKELSLDLDFTMLHLFGKLNIGSNEDGEKGYAGELDIEIKELFELKCSGGYYSHKASNLSDEEKEMLKADDPDFKDVADSNIKDVNYSWGYFTISVASEAGLRFDPIVINRISGGFYFNCKPQAAEAAEGKKSHEFVGTPKGQYGMIGIAFGLGMSTSAGEKVLKLDADMLVVYDRKNKNLSAFKFYGGVEAVGSLIKADVNLVYVNDKNSSGVTQDRYLSLNMTVEAGWTTKELEGYIGKLNEKLESVKGEFEKFSSDIKGLDIEKVVNPKQGLKRLSGKGNENPPDYDKLDKLSEEDSGETLTADSDDKTKRNDLGLTALRTTVQLEFLVTWVKNAKPNNTPKWHLYLGQPEKDKRCTFTYIDFDSKICSMHIGADGYICVGNELPDNGELPPIPTKISEFLSGHKSSTTDMGADESKAQQSRMAAVRAMLNPNNIGGGVMVGASAWGDITLNLGLLYGGLGATAGFDASLINYGNSAFCVNNGSTMGYKGWYATGQLYAYLWAKLGVHIDLGALYEGDIDFFTAGIGGVLQVGLPHPSWVEGQARIKMSFLGGLFKVNKKFQFSAGDHCVPFRGNALDGFSLFSGVNMGSDSLYQALCRPEFAVSKADVSKMLISTNASLGSHYRLIDPTYLAEMAKEFYNKEESEITDELRDSLSLQASHTYVFDMLKKTNEYGKMGVRLVDLSEYPTSWLKENPNLTEEEFYEKCYQVLNVDYRFNPQPYRNLLAAVASQYYKRKNTLYDGSCRMGSYDISDTHELEIIKKNEVSRMSNLLLREVINGVTLMPEQVNGLNNDIVNGNSIIEKKVNFREDKGQTYHLCDMEVEKGHCYALILCGTAYEINNGEKTWCQYYYKNGDKTEETPMKWTQEKIWFFRVKDDDEDKVDTYEMSTLEPYVALAYPSVDGTKVQNNSTEPFTAYFGDIMEPTVALNRDLTKDLPADKLKWHLTAYDAKEFAQKDSTECWKYVQTKNADYQTGGNCINLHPASEFERVNKFSNAISAEGQAYDYSNELYHLQLAYTYKVPERNADGTVKRHFNQSWASAVETDRDTTVYLVDLWMKTAPHGVTVKGMSNTQDDTWLQTTNRNTSGELLPYVEQFVGASPTEEPKFNYIITHNDDEIVFQNLKYKNKDKVEVAPYRLIDPWLYFAYLSKYTFIGDRALNSYSFDPQYIPFASESLIYDYNGSVVNSDFIKGDNSKSLRTLRDEMYKTWDTWSFNDSKQPAWPLPTTLKTAGGLTAANQNGKASTVTPRAINLTKNDRSFGYAEMVRDFMAPYYVAEQLSAKITEEARNVFARFAYFWDNSSKKITDEKSLDYWVGYFNKLHRGQYLEVSERGVTVRVPYYQLPLIFGGTFGYSKDDSGKSYFNGFELKPSSRGFDSSITGGINKDDKKASEGRWSTDLSNILFFRLVGTESVQGQYGSYVSPQAFRRTAKTEYEASYNTIGENPTVSLDKFDSYLSLNEVSRFRGSSYRVDSYNLETGFYEVNNRAAEPWSEIFDIGYDGDDFMTMAELNDHLNYTERDLDTTLDRPMPCLIWTESNSTMTLIYSQHNYKMGDKYGGREITALWRGENCMNSSKTQNSNERGKATKFVIDSSMKDAYINDMSSWFYANFSLKDITGLANLKTENVTDMSNMFNNCMELETLDLTKFNTSNVRNMESMFSQCIKLKTLKQNFDTRNVTNMSNMFFQCESLTSLNLNNFKDDNVVTTMGMFSTCSKLETLNLGNFKGDLVENANNMFSGCKVLKNLDIRSYGGFKIHECQSMFLGCEKLGTLHIERFSPDRVEYEDCKLMFHYVNQSLVSYIAYDLDNDIYVQIPGTKNVTKHPNKVIVAQNKQGEYELLMTKTTKDLKIGSTYDIDGKKTVYEGMKVVKMWNYSDIQNTSNSIPWASYKSSLVRVTIDPSFIPDSKTFLQGSLVESSDLIQTTKGWFANCTNVVAIEGLNNLYTEQCEDISNMFENCYKLESIDLSNISMFSLKQMRAMFKGCRSLKKVKINLIPNFHHEETKDLSELFAGCSSLTSLEFPQGTATSNITNMSKMFYGCESLVSLDLTDLATESVTNMESMFEGCKKLETLKTSKYYFKTGSVKNMKRMFASCSSLKELDLSGLDTKSATNMQEIFDGCSSMWKLFLGSWNTEKVQNMTRMFNGCTSLQDLNIVGFNTAKLSQCSEMFKGVPYQCTIYIPYDISTQIHPNQIKKPTYPNLVIAQPAQVIQYKDGDGVSLVFLSSNTKYSSEKKSGYQNTWNGHEILRVWSGTEVLDAYSLHKGEFNPDIWYNTKEYKSISFDSSFANVYPISTHSWFYQVKVSSIEGLQYLNTSRVTDMENMFYNCKNLSTLDLSHFDTSNVTDMSYMFFGCDNLKSLDLSNFDTSNVTNMCDMFGFCSGLTSLDLSNFNTSKVTKMGSMFFNCKNLETLDLSNFDTSNVTDMSDIFNLCEKLVTLDLSSFNTSKVTDMGGMFSYCRGLTSLDLSHFDTSKVTSMSNMFADCSSLEELDLSSFDTSSLVSQENQYGGGLRKTFSGDKNLKKLWLGNKFNLSGIGDQKNTFDKGDDGSRVSGLQVIVPAEKLQQYRKDFTSKLGFVEGQTGWFTTEGPRVIWTQDNSSLTFTYFSTVSKAGDDFNGHRVTKVWSGEELTNSPENEAPAWAKTVSSNNAIVAADGSVYGKVTTVVIDESFSEVKPHATSHWFHLGNQLKTINGLENLNTSEVESMDRMFATCGISGLDDININTSKVKSMEGMFAESLISTIDNIDKFDTQNVENMSNMFNGCVNLQSAIFSNMYTGKVTDMSGMFSNCSHLEELDLRRFNWSKVDDVSDMFNGSTAMKTLRLRNFNPSAIAINRSKNVFNGVSGVKVLIDKYEFECPNLRSDFARLGFTSETGSILFKTAQAIWTEGNSTLTFICSTDGAVFVPRDDFNGQTVTAVWSDNDILNTPVNEGKVPWTETIQGKVRKVVFNSSFSSVLPKNTAYWFADNKNSVLSEISGLGYLKTDNVTDMSGMFYNCRSLPTLDLIKFNFGKVTSMKDMFRGCEKLRSLTLPKASPSSVTDLSGMFYDCLALTSLDLRYIQPNRLTTMRDMFRNCVSLKSLDVSRLQTKYVTDMSGLFAGCGLKAIDISNFNTTNVSNADMMFYKSSVRLLTLGEQFMFPKLKTMATDAFTGVRNVEVTLPDVNRILVWENLIDKLGFEIGDGNDGVSTREKAIQVIWTEDNKTLSFIYAKVVNDGDDYNGHTVTKVWNYKYIYTKEEPAWVNTVNRNVTTVEIDPTFKDAKITSTSQWFKLGPQLTKINGLENLNTQDVSSMSSMFEGCGVESIDLRHFNTTNVAKMNRMFFGCSKLHSLNVSSFNTSNVKSISEMFAYCSSLTNLNLSSFNTTNVVNMYRMFYNCSKLQSLNVSSFNTSKVESMLEMFAYCSSLTDLNLSSFNTGKVKTMCHMFRNCNKLTRLLIPNFNTRSVTDMKGLFLNCGELTSLDLRSFDVSIVQDISSMFSGCSNLKSLYLNAFSLKPSTINHSKDVFYRVKGLQVSLPLQVYSTNVKKENIQKQFKQLNFTKTTGTIQFVRY